jgi:hypothetical protein
VYIAAILSGAAGVAVSGAVQSLWAIAWGLVILIAGVTCFVTWGDHDRLEVRDYYCSYNCNLIVA